MINLKCFNAKSYFFGEVNSCTTSDLVIIAKNGQVKIHKLVLIKHIPQLKDMFCTHCLDNHEMVSILVPHVDINLLRNAVKLLYLNDNVKDLAELIGMSSFIFTSVISNPNVVSDNASESFNECNVIESEDLHEEVKLEMSEEKLLDDEANIIESESETVEEDCEDQRMLTPSLANRKVTKQSVRQMLSRDQVRMKKISANFVETVNRPTLTFELLESGQLNMFGNLSLCKWSLEREGSFLKEMRKKMETIQTSAEPGKFFNLAEQIRSDHQDQVPELDVVSKNSILEYPKLPYYIGSRKFWTTTPVRKFMSKIFLLEGFGRSNKNRYGIGLPPPGYDESVYPWAKFTGVNPPADYKTCLPSGGKIAVGWSSILYLQFESMYRYKYGDAVDKHVLDPPFPKWDGTADLAAAYRDYLNTLENEKQI